MPNATDKSATEAIRDLSLGRLAWARWFTDALITPMTDAQIVHRASGKGNHALWVMGHMAATDEFFRSTLSGTQPEFDETFMDLFGGGSEINPDAKVYPSRSVVAAAMVGARDRLIAWWSKLDEAHLDAPLTNGLEQFSPDVRTVPITIAMHELFHSGQVASCRSSLGLPRVLQ